MLDLLVIDIEQLRDEILRIISEPFEFIRSHIIEIPLGWETLMRRTALPLFAIQVE